METKQAFGQFIAAKRRDANLTQHELAGKLYVTESAVSKWERGVSYPDISLVAAICGALNVSEHELITASEDFQQRTIERQARSWRNFLMGYSLVFYICYGITLLICFIVNLATTHSLSWFFIVLTSVMCAFSLTSLPVLLKKHRGVLTLAGFFATLNLLLLVCCIYTGGSWFGTAFVALLFSFAVVFLPFVFRYANPPGAIRSHGGLVCLTADTLLLFLLLVVTGALKEHGALPSALVALILPWGILMSVRYVRLNKLFRAAICIVFTEVHLALLGPALNAIIDGKPFKLWPMNLADWSSDALINGNVTLVAVLFCSVVAAAFCVGGITMTVKRARK
ncbi:hypothetical protein FACS1894208_03680 [Clostridia bacterium]|nr:hypothetical protein FACS1894208_03680 [Clostridia bacterium]